MNGVRAQGNGEIKVPTRQTRVGSAQIRFRISRPGPPPVDLRHLQHVSLTTGRKPQLGDCSSGIDSDCGFIPDAYC